MKKIDGPVPAWPGDPAAIGADGVDFEAVAHVLGNTCCWRGRTRRFLSVAQRAATVCTAAQSLGGLRGEDRRRLGLHALLADAWRAWVAESVDGASGKAAEKHARERAAAQRAVLDAAGAGTDLPDSWSQALALTRRMADAALIRDLPDAGIEAPRDGAPQFPPLRERTRPMPPDRAAERWLELLEALRAAAPSRGADE